MAFVSVPKDLTKVKTKIIFNLTKGQLICIGIAAALGVPFYFLTRGVLGTSNAATGMVLLMLPAFLFPTIVGMMICHSYTTVVGTVRSMQSAAIRSFSRTS